MTTQLTDPWAPPPDVVCDFCRYTNAGTPLPPLSYTVNEMTFPPEGDLFYDVVTPMGISIVFDSNDSLGLGLPYTLVPPGVQIVSYEWDLGNGVTATGPVISTSYSYTLAPPDAAATLTVVDSLNRIYSTTHRLNLAWTNITVGEPSGSVTRASAGSAR